MIGGTCVAPVSQTNTGQLRHAQRSKVTGVNGASLPAHTCLFEHNKAYRLLANQPTAIHPLLHPPTLCLICVFAQMLFSLKIYFCDLYLQHNTDTNLSKNDLSLAIFLIRSLIPAQYIIHYIILYYPVHYKGINQAGHRGTTIDAWSMNR